MQRGDADATARPRSLGEQMRFLNTHQEKQMAMQPDMIIQYAHHLHDYYQAQGISDPIVRAEAWVTLNGAPSKLMIDPNRDLSEVELGLGASDWILSND